MIYPKVRCIFGVVVFLVISLMPVLGIFADEAERTAQLGYCCYIADPREGFDACLYDPMDDVFYEQECCDDEYNKCWGDVSVWNMDYTWELRLSCPEYVAPCAETDPLLDDAIYQNASAQNISRRGYMCERQTNPWNCTYEPIGCGPKTTWANFLYKTCTQAECNDDYCD